jgi:hypothetical protein
MRCGSRSESAVGVATLTRVLAAALLFVGLSCSTTSAPSDDGQSGCVTDFSCPFGEECTGNGCTPIAASVYPHIQTASMLLRDPLSSAETAWRAQHNDLLIGGIDPDVARAVNPNVRMFEYVVSRFHRLDSGPKNASDWAVAHGYDPEDFYLHYREDVDVPTWESTVVVPGFPAGRVPGWNPGGPNASATSRAQSRVVGYNNAGGEPWYFANVANPAYRSFLAYVIEGLIDGTWYHNQPFASGPIDGVLMDEAIWYPIFGEGLLDHSNEYYGQPIVDDHPYTRAIEGLYPAMAQDMMDAFASTKDIMPNYGHVMFLNYPNRCAENIQSTTPWILGEVWVQYTGAASPTTGNNRTITYESDYVNAVREIVLQTRSGGRRVLGAQDRVNGVAGTDRGKLFTLGLYYLLSNKHTYYMYESAGHAYGGDASTWAWNPAVQYDIGQPDVVPSGMVDFEGRANTKEHYVFATGPDPVNPSLTYRVLARRFTNALVLVKMLPAGSTVDNSSITTHALGGNYGVLQADGLIGPIVTQASIRNNEALILIPLD